MPNERVFISEPSKTKVRVKKLKKSSDEDPLDLVLYDSKKKYFSMFRIYNDKEIGIDVALQNYLMDNDMDEDCSSDDEIVRQGISRGIKVLTSALTKKKPINNKEIDSD